MAVWASGCLCALTLFTMEGRTEFVEKVCDIHGDARISSHAMLCKV